VTEVQPPRMIKIVVTMPQRIGSKASRSIHASLWRSGYELFEHTSHELPPRGARALRMGVSNFPPPFSASLLTRGWWWGEADQSPPVGGPFASSEPSFASLILADEVSSDNSAGRILDWLISSVVLLAEDSRVSVVRFAIIELHQCGAICGEGRT
jgi:hypothetical protein